MSPSQNTAPGPAAPKSTIVRLEATANGSKTDTVLLTAAPPTIEISAMFDGKEYELRGAAMPTTRAYKRAVH